MKGTIEINYTLNSDGLITNELNLDGQLRIVDLLTILDSAQNSINSEFVKCLENKVIESESEDSTIIQNLKVKDLT
jgi:hypothetical protein